MVHGNSMNLVSVLVMAFQYLARIKNLFFLFCLDLVFLMATCIFHSFWLSCFEISLVFLCTASRRNNSFYFLQPLDTRIRGVSLDLDECWSYLPCLYATFVCTFEMFVLSNLINLSGIQEAIVNSETNGDSLLNAGSILHMDYLIISGSLLLFY